MKRKEIKQFNFKKIINEELYGNKDHLFENSDDDEDDEDTDGVDGLDVVIFGMNEVIDSIVEYTTDELESMSDYVEESDDATSVYEILEELVKYLNKTKEELSKYTYSDDEDE